VVAESEGTIRGLNTARATLQSHRAQFALMRALDAMFAGSAATESRFAYADRFWGS